MAHLHKIHDTDKHFVIDPITRVITNVSESDPKPKIIVIQGDHDSERFTFEMPRYIEGHDMSLCNKVRVHYSNIDQQTKEQNDGVYEPDDFQVFPEDESIVVCSWLISGNATKLIGPLHFGLCFSCLDGDAVSYSWNTAIHKGISVSDGMDNGEAVATEYSDVLESWKDDLFSRTSTKVEVDGSALVFENSERSTIRQELEDGVVVPAKAQTAVFANTAASASMASSASKADTAQYADRAGTARTADTATRAAEADIADFAKEAGSARGSTTAQHAEEASFATLAQTAATLNNKPVAEFIGHGTGFTAKAWHGADCNELCDEGRYFIFNGSNYPGDPNKFPADNLPEIPGWGFLDVSFFNGEGFDPGLGTALACIRQVFTAYDTGKVYTRVGHRQGAAVDWSIPWRDLSEEVRIASLETWNSLQAQSISAMYDGAITLSNTDFTTVTREDGGWTSVRAGMYMVRVSHTSGAMFSFMFDVPPNDVKPMSACFKVPHSGLDYVVQALKPTHSAEHKLNVVQPSNAGQNTHEAGFTVSVRPIGVPYTEG